MSELRCPICQAVLSKCEMAGGISWYACINGECPIRNHKFGSEAAEALSGLNRRAPSAAPLNGSRSMRASRVATVNVRANDSDVSGGGQSMARTGAGDDRLIDPDSISIAAAPAPERPS